MLPLIIQLAGQLYLFVVKSSGPASASTLTVLLEDLLVFVPYEVALKLSERTKDTKYHAAATRSGIHRLTYTIKADPPLFKERHNIDKMNQRST